MTDTAIHLPLAPAALDVVHRAGWLVRVAALMLAVAASGLVAPAPALAAPVRTPHVEAELVAATTALVPGRPLQAALRLKMEHGWHTYWRNPGDSGLPTTLAWTLPAGIEAGPIEWPVPDLQRAGPLANFGYEGEVLLPVELRTTAELRPGTTAELKARADWLVCKEICIPEGVDLSLALPVAREAAADSRWAAPLAATKAALPRPLSDGWQATARGDGPRIVLTLLPPAAASDPGTLHFYPYVESLIEPSPPQPLVRTSSGFELTLPAAANLGAVPPRLEGVLTTTAGFAPGIRAASLDLPLAGTVTPGGKAALAAAPALNLTAPASSASAMSAAVALPSTAGAGLSFGLALVFAFLGGLILNLMPCVFPVLSIKVLGFAEHHDSRPTLRREALAYASGVVLTFVVLGLALAALRAAGEQLGWGFQLQSPAVVAALAILFFVLALNLSGVFEFGSLLPSAAASWTAKNRSVDAFGSGVLAVVVASPCTAPFMGAALGYAFTGSAAVTLAVFVALGLGMALPYVLLAWFPGWRRRLPRPGPWLGRFKEFLAFPLYATVIWLAWVLGVQRDVDALLRLLVVLLGVGFVLWAWRILRSGGRRPWGIAAALALAGVLVAAWPLFAAESVPIERAASGPVPGADSAGGSTAGSAAGSAAGSTAGSTAGTATGIAAPGKAPPTWGDFAPARVTELAAAGRPVFVDFTAAWCVTCQVNKRLVLTAPDVLAAFAARDVVLLRADWTRHDPVITQALAALGRNGVPVYVLYRPGKEPLLLPEILQRDTVVAALATL